MIPFSSTYLEGKNIDGINMIDYILIFDDINSIIIDDINII